MNSDECFENFIYLVKDTNDTTDSDKENEVNISSKRLRSSKNQIDKMILFIKDHNEEDMNDELWDNLTTDLNSIGPVIHPVKKWKRVWSVHKYNNKKSQRSNPTEISAGASSAQYVPSNSTEQSVGQMNDVLGQLTRLHEKFDAMDLKVDKMYSVLDEISKKFV